MRDDIDEDGLVGNVVLDPNGNVIQFLADFDDFHVFKIFYDEASNADYASSGAVDVINVVWLGQPDVTSQQEEPSVPFGQPAAALVRRDYQLTGVDDGSIGPSAQSPDGDWPYGATLHSHASKSTTKALGLTYGFRGFQVGQQNYATANGAIIGRSYWNSDVENQVIGPQAGLVWTWQRGKWSTVLQGTAMAGYNYRTEELKTVMGPERIPGALNQPINPVRIETRSYVALHAFTPVGELRAATDYRLTKSVTLKTAWTTFAVQELASAYYQGDDRATLQEAFAFNTDSLLVHDIFCGIEFLR